MADQGGVQAERRLVVKDAVGALVGAAISPHAEGKPVGLPAFHLAAQWPGGLGRQVYLLGLELAKVVTDRGGWAHSACKLPGDQVDDLMLHPAVSSARAATARALRNQRLEDGYMHVLTGLRRSSRSSLNGAGPAQEGVTVTSVLPPAVIWNWLMGPAELGIEPG